MHGSACVCVLLEAAAVDDDDDAAAAAATDVAFVVAIVAAVHPGGHFVHTYIQHVAYRAAGATMFYNY